MTEHEIRSRIGELWLEIRQCGCYCRKADDSHERYVCNRHAQLAELPKLALPAWYAGEQVARNTKW